MNSIEMILLGSLLLVATAAGVGGAWMYIHVRRLRTQHLELAAGVAATLRELELLAGMAAKAGVHVNRVDRDYAGLAERVDALELRGESRPYDRAIDSARQGTDSNRLARQFGLSPTEASLVTLLHGAKRRA